MRSLPKTIASGANTIGTIAGAAICADQLISASFQAVSGDTTAVGTMQIQISNDYPTGGQARAAFTPTNWSNLAPATISIAAGAAPAALLVPVMSFGYIRAVVTITTSGTTSISINMLAMGV